MVLGAGIQRLRDDDGPHDHAEQGAREQGSSCPGTEQPEGTAPASKFAGREDFGFG